MPNAVGTMYATWTDPDGVEWLLSRIDEDDPGWFTTSGPAGWGAPPYEIVTDPLSRGGVNVRFVRAEPARINWPIHIHGDTYLDFTDRFRQLRRAFLLTLHRRSPGILRVARPDGSAREIEAFYEEGFAGGAGENWLYANPVVTLLCPTPYWRDAIDTVLPFDYDEGGSFLAPYPHVSSATLGTTVVTNTGEVDAWPVWTVTGPLVAVTGTNETTGHSFQMTYTLGAGQTLVITSDPPTASGPAGQNIISSLNWPAAYLWPLVPGDNTVSFSVSGAGIGTSVQLAYRNRYEGV